MLNNIIDYFTRRRQQNLLRKSFQNHELFLYGPIKIVHEKNIDIAKEGRVSFNAYCYINATEKVTIGSNVSFSAHSMVITTSLDKDDLHGYAHVSKPITIGSNVQIGAGAIILPGVSIGDNVLVGAGAVVTKNIASNSTVVGNPARVLT